MHHGRTNVDEQDIIVHEYFDFAHFHIASLLGGRFESAGFLVPTLNWNWKLRIAL